MAEAVLSLHCTVKGPSRRRLRRPGYGTVTVLLCLCPLFEMIPSFVKPLTSFACHSVSPLCCKSYLLFRRHPCLPKMSPCLFPVAPLIRSKRSGRQRIHCPSLAETVLHSVRGDFRTCEEQPYRGGATPAEPGLAHAPVVGLGGGRDHDRLLHPLVSRALLQMGLVSCFCCCWYCCC